MTEQVGTVARQINRWVCHKLECFTDFLQVYARNPGAGERYYLELNAGCGQCMCSGTDCLIEGSPLRALNAGFARYIFVATDDADAVSLKGLTGARDKGCIDIITGNSNQASFTRRLLDMIPRSAASLVYIDPPGYRWLRWKTIERLAQGGRDGKGHKPDMLLIFPLEMALLRNLARPECQGSISRLYGNHEWQAVRQEKVGGQIEPDEVRQRLVSLFKANLKGLGYRYVDDYRPGSFGRQPFYHVIWASDGTGGAKLLAEAWGRPRYLPCELLYRRDGSDE